MPLQGQSGRIGHFNLYFISCNIKMAVSRPSCTFLASVVLVSCLFPVNSILPDNTGGYAITIAFDESIPQNSTATQVLLQNVQTTLENFSVKLWEASRHRFYIKTVDVLIPRLWTVEKVTHSISHTYDSSTIRISNGSQARTENPFGCGQSGNFIELPLSFFNSSDAGRYGPTWKALLNLWASYRWGLYEEHGHVGNSKYPYSHRNLETDEWEVTGCSDNPIPGRFVNNESLECAASDTSEASSSCRFVPDQSATNATTSLMHFHWIDSIVNFCDETNHNKLSPNRQNFLCDYKSAWEVISETRDFKAASNPRNDSLPKVSFKLVQHSRKPRLYILLDRGKIQGSVSLATQIPRALVNFLNDPEWKDTIMAVGTYPGKNTQEYMDQNIGWSKLNDTVDQFADVIGKLELDGPLQRNFPEAILSVLDNIKMSTLENKVAMLVVKYGADLSNFANYPPESELIHALRELGVVLNAIELHIANHTAKSHLSELAKETGGVYTVISNPGEAANAFGNVFWHLTNILRQDSAEARKKYRTILRSEITPGLVTRFKVPKSKEQVTSSSKVQAYFSTNDATLSRHHFIVQGTVIVNETTLIQPIENVNFRKSPDWKETGGKWTYVLEFLNDEIETYSEVMTRLNCSSCRSASLLITTDSAVAETRDVKISVITNVENSSVDLSTSGPITISAKVFSSGSPVVNAQVLALITEIGGQISHLSLTDDGEGMPDEEVNDGIYSGYFVPGRDGQYKISVSVQGNSADRFQTLKSRKPDIIRSLKVATNQKLRHGELLPIDQEMGCIGAQCDMAVLPDSYMESVDLYMNLEVSNTASYTPEPTKISEVIIVPENPEEIQMMWVAPEVPGTALSVSSYDMRYSSSRENLINDYENQQQVPGISSMKPKSPGFLETIKVARPAQTTFYAMRSGYRGQISKMSLISSIEIENQDPPSTTTLASSSVSTEISSTTDVESTTVSSTSTDPTVPDPSSSLTESTVPPDVSSSTEAVSPTESTTSPIIPTDPPSPTSPSTTKKPWAKTGGGIAIITVIVIIVVAAIVFAIFYVWKTRSTSVAKINPPPVQPRSSILL